VAGVLLARCQYELYQFNRFAGGRGAVQLFQQTSHSAFHGEWLPPYIRAAMLFGLGATIFTAGWLVVQLLARCPRALQSEVAAHSIAERRPYRLHWLTCLALLIVGGALGWCQVVGGPEGIVDAEGSWARRFGWPWNHFHSWGSAVPERPWWSAHFSASVAGANTLVSFVVLACVVAVAESFAKRRRWLQLRLSTLFAAVAVLAALFAFLHYERRWGSLYLHSVPVGFEYSRLAWHPWPLRLPLLFGIGCTIYAAACLGARLAGRCAGRLRSAIVSDSEE
jgi:hypothetical protein